ncbi:Transmembrane protein 129 [Trichoplax sp. H2]|nr:Transmembrane protein 129 [Trichoplax sp. H2]|eukprot:RDD37261.1 Transmembrane protein 129 [Trichoplax sp. H2]
MDLTFFTLVYFLILFCLIAPPTEFRRSGLTIEYILSSYLGSENIDFIGYHVRRTTANLLFHSCLPLSYYIILILLNYLSAENYPFSPWAGGIYWDVYFYMTSSIALLAITLGYYWSSSKWQHHPIVTNLQQFGQPWRVVSSSVNNEFRRIEKFSSGELNFCTYITDSWILKISTYTLLIAHKHDAKLSIVDSQTYQLAVDSPTAVQKLHIRVKSVQRGKCDFIIVLNSEKYQELTGMLEEPIENMRNLVIQQSLSDKFVVAFKEQVMRNDRYIIPENAPAPEQCIGCLTKSADVKLQKLCYPPQEGECQSCFCKPMWCLDCMGKWFACRQDQRRIETWLSSKAPCPTCRATFCVLDVCAIEIL